MSIPRVCEWNHIETLVCFLCRSASLLVPPTEDSSANSFKISVTDYRLLVTGAGIGTGTGSWFFIVSTQRHDVLQENCACIHYVDPWVVSHAYGQSKPQQWLQLNVCFIFGVCEVFNWGILVWEILSVMQVKPPSTNPISTLSAGCFIVAS